MNKPTLKILVCYHKYAQLREGDIFVPIHCGRTLAEKNVINGCLAADELQWLKDNMIGDDTGDNISHLNGHFCELTATYWAWKNYDKLGNPDYIGLEHYRRFFAPEDITNAENYDISAAFVRFKKNETLHKQFMAGHDTDDLDNAIALLDSEYRTTAKQYLSESEGYFFNMFIMKRELFFEYCSWIFDVLFKLHSQIEYAKYNEYNQRMIGFIAERLTGIFITQKAQKYRIKPCQIVLSDVNIKLPLKPQYRDDAIVICLASDDTYMPYLSATITSIKAHRNSADCYDICILENGVSDSIKKRIQSMRCDNFSIRFINMEEYIDKADAQRFVIHSHFSIASYYRFFIPQIFKNYSKVLYIDCDIVVCDDIAELYRTDLGEYCLGAVPDIEIRRCLNIDHHNNNKMHQYLCDTLKMKNPQMYFQSGVLLCDISKLQQINLTQKCLQRLQEIGNPLYVDQCVLNSVLDGAYQKISMHWNVLWQLPYFSKNLQQELPAYDYREYYNARQQPRIIHYAGIAKPWCNPEIELADVWWKYARLTPFYEILLGGMINKQTISATDDAIQSIKYVKLIWNYYRNKKLYRKYRLLAKITLGATRRKYKVLKKETKQRLKEAKKILNDLSI